MLDFDFEKLCSVSLSHINVYACLVCGKYFQGNLDNDFDFSHRSVKLISLIVISFIFSFLGRGRRSHAYTHSVQVDHHVFLNLRTLKVIFISKRKVVCGEISDSQLGRQSETILCENPRQ